jgi:hypothetical protein
LQKSEGFRVKASEGEVVVLYFEPSAILRRRINSESEVLRLSRRGNNMAKSTPSFEFTDGGIQEFVILL